MKKFIFSSLVLPLAFSAQAEINEIYPKGNSLTAKEFFCEHSQLNEQCLVDKLKNEMNELIEIPFSDFDKIRAEEHEEEIEIYVGDKFYTSTYMRGNISSLRNHLKKVVKEAKVSKKSIYIPKVHNNNGYFVPLISSTFWVPVFMGPTKEQISDYKNNIFVVEEIGKNKKEIKWLRGEKNRLESTVDRLNRKNNDLGWKIKSLTNRIDKLEKLLNNQKEKNLKIDWPQAPKK